MIEWFCALIPFSAIAAYRIYSAALGGKHVPLIPVVLLLICIPLQIAAITRWNATSLAHDAQDRIGAIGMVVAAIRQSSKPVISDDMTLPIRAGKRVEWEPAITAELGQVHIYDQQQFVDMVRRGDFAFFVTEDGRGSRVFDSRYNPAVADAMDAAYPRKKTIAGLLIHLPQRSATQ